MSNPEPVWTYRGYQLRPSEFTTAMAHFFRAEISRANIWRQRLDTTTNWAVVSTGAAISFAFSEPLFFAPVLILNTFLVTMFLAIESRRYQYYELWSSRVRLLETDFYAAMLVPPFHPSADWAESLAESLLHPQFPISSMEAFGRRLRRNYLWIYVILGAAFIAKLWLQPTPAANLAELLERATIGPIPGSIVILLGVSYNLLLILIAVLTIGLHEASGEVLPKFGLAFLHIDQEDDRGKVSRWRAWFRPTARRQQLLAFIITDKAHEVSSRILADMARGVTSVTGTGMYTGQTHSVLMCALTITEVNHLKLLVSQEDQNAFVIVSPAQGVYGKGFSPLQAEKA